MPREKMIIGSIWKIPTYEYATEPDELKICDENEQLWWVFADYGNKQYGAYGVKKDDPLHYADRDKAMERIINRLEHKKSVITEKLEIAKKSRGE